MAESDSDLKKADRLTIQHLLCEVERLRHLLNLAEIRILNLESILQAYEPIKPSPPQSISQSPSRGL